MEKNSSKAQKIFYSEEGLKEFIRFLDGNREPLIQDVISMEGEKTSRRRLQSRLLSTTDDDVETSDGTNEHAHASERWTLARL